MPGHDSAVMRRFAEQLVMLEADRAAQQLRCRGGECRMPQQVVKAGGDTPGPERVEQHMVGIGGLVRMVLVKQFSIFPRRVQQPGQFLSERLYLLVRENANSAQVTILAKEVDLLGAQLVLRNRAMSHIGEKRTYGTMFQRKIVRHG